MPIFLMFKILPFNNYIFSYFRHFPSASCDNKTDYKHSFKRYRQIYTDAQKQKTKCECKKYIHVFVFRRVYKIIYIVFFFFLIKSAWWTVSRENGGRRQPFRLLNGNTREHVFGACVVSFLFVLTAVNTDSEDGGWHLTFK